MNEVRELLSTDFWQTLGQRSIDWAINTIPALLVILVLTLVSLWVVGVALRRTRSLMVKRLKNSSRVKDPSELEKRVDTLIGVLRSAIRIAVWAMVFMLILKRIGIDIAPLLAGAGIAGLAIGFGAQELVRDVISGFFMLFENQVRAGDVAIVDGTGGLVESVGLRTTVLRGLDGTVHVFQNGKIGTLSNMTKEWSGAVFDIGVAYKEDTDAVVAVMKEVAEELREDEKFKDLINEPLEVFGVDKFADSAVVIKARFKTKPIQQWAVGREYRRRLKKAFDAKGIEIPFPHQTVYWGAEIDPLVLQQQAQAS